MIDIAWLCALAIRSVYWLVLLACNFLGYSTLWAHREIKQRGERYDARRCKVPSHVAIVNNDRPINKNMLLSLLEISLDENIRRLTIYDPSNDYSSLAREIRIFCRSKHIKIIMDCTNCSDDLSCYRLVVQLLSSGSGRSVLVKTCRELSSSSAPITVNGVTGHLAGKYSLLEPELLIQLDVPRPSLGSHRKSLFIPMFLKGITNLGWCGFQVGSVPSLCGYPPWCLRVTEIVAVRSLPCSRFAFEECLETFSKRDIRLGK